LSHPPAAFALETPVETLAMKKKRESSADAPVVSSQISDSMSGWVRKGNGPWKPAHGRRIVVVDSGIFPMFGIAPGGTMTIDLSKFWKAARRYRRSTPRNAERDTEITTLWNDDRTEGWIVRRLKPKYPKITLAVVKSVLRRARAAGVLKAHRE